MQGLPHKINTLTLFHLDLMEYASFSDYREIQNEFVQTRWYSWLHVRYTVTSWKSQTKQKNKVFRQPDCTVYKLGQRLRRNQNLPSFLDLSECQKPTWQQTETQLKPSSSITFYLFYTLVKKKCILCSTDSQSGKWQYRLKL